MFNPFQKLFNSSKIAEASKQFIMENSTFFVHWLLEVQFCDRMPSTIFQLTDPTRLISKRTPWRHQIVLSTRLHSSAPYLKWGTHFQVVYILVFSSSRDGRQDICKNVDCCSFNDDDRWWGIGELKNPDINMVIWVHRAYSYHRFLTTTSWCVHCATPYIICY